MVGTTSYEEIADALDGRIDEELNLLPVIGSMALTMPAGTPRARLFRATFEMLFYVNFVDAEVKALLRAAFLEPHRRVIWEKYVALMVHEALITTPKLASRTVRALDAMHSSAAELAQETEQGTLRISTDELRAAIRKYKADVRPITSDQVLMATLANVRNTVAAHHLDRQSPDAPLTMVTFWHEVARQGRENGATLLNSAIIRAAQQTVQATQRFAKALTRVVLGGAHDGS